MSANAPHEGSPNRWALLGVLFLIGTVSYIDRNILPVLLEPIGREFNLSDSTLGLLGGAPFALCFALFSVPLARLADVWSRRAVLLGSLLFWSVMTALCGLASSPHLLFAARMGVGAGEGGAIPTAHAMIADAFPPGERARAFAIFTTAAAIGALIAGVAGGIAAERFGWRAALLLMAALSIPVGLLAFAVLKREESKSVALRAPQSDIGSDLSALFKLRPFVLILAGLTSYALFAFGPLIFVPAFLVRTLGVDLGAAGAGQGVALLAGTLLGALGGGALADRLAQRDPRWLVRAPALGMLGALPVALACFSAADLGAFLFWLACLVTLITGMLPPALAAVQHVCGAERRALAAAVVLASLHAVGMTLGPFLTGLISDVLTQSEGADHALRTAMSVMACFLLPAAALLAAAADQLGADGVSREGERPA